MMNSAVEIVVDLYKAMSAEEQAECLRQMAQDKAAPWMPVGGGGAGAAGVVVSGGGGAASIAVSGGAKAFGKSFGKKAFRPYWVKTVDSVDKSSANAHGAEGPWGFEATQSKPVLLGLSKPRHLYAVLKPAPGATARVVDDDGFTVEVLDAVLVLTSKEWEDIKTALVTLL